LALLLLERKTGIGRFSGLPADHPGIDFCKMP